MTEQSPISSLSKEELSRMIDAHALDEAYTYVFNIREQSLIASENSYVGFYELPTVFPYKAFRTLPAKAKIAYDKDSLQESVRINEIAQLMDLLYEYRTNEKVDDVVFLLSVYFISQHMDGVFKDPWHHQSVCRFMDIHAFNAIDQMGRTILRDLEGKSPDFLFPKDIKAFLAKYRDCIDDPKWQEDHLSEATRERIEETKDAVAYDLAEAYQVYADFLLDYMISPDVVKKQTIGLIQEGYFDDKYFVNKTLCTSKESPLYRKTRQRLHDKYVRRSVDHNRSKGKDM